MSLQKRYLKSRPESKVTFTLPAGAASADARVCVVGDFNAWDPEATPMTRLKSGAWKATVDLAVDRTYAFRYLIDGCIWENDGEADGYAPTGVDHEENSLVRV